MQYDPYEDKLQNAETFSMFDEKSVVTPKLGDQYVNTEILLPREDKMTRCWVIHQKCDADCTLIGRSNENPIMDTCLYEVEFSRREMTELLANIIAESMYFQCDVNGNKYLLLMAFIDRWKNDSTSV